MAARYRADSFIKNTALIDSRFLDVNTLPRLQTSVYDTEYAIESDFNLRPDLLAHNLYGNSYLWWIFALRNPDIIRDPIRDFTTGTKIMLPSNGAVKTLSNTITGVN